MEEIAFYYPQGHESHFELSHPERPERVETIRRALVAAGWWERYPQLTPQSLSTEQLTRVHDPAYLETLQALCQRGLHLDGDTYTTPDSWRLALNAAGGAVAAAYAVWTGSSRCALALTRPPGHHATRRRGMGFCLLNNAALAADYLLSPPLEGAANASKLAIVDLDLHHGNGTQDIFWQRGDVLYISTHQSPLYPGTGRLEEIGAGEGEGCTANFPFPPSTGDHAFSAVMQELILPLLDRFSPQMLLVSVGFDTHWRDPLGHLLLSAQGYGELIAQLSAWAEAHCEGKIALFLEGGYDLEAGAACVQAAVAALLEQPFEDPLGPAPYDESNAWRIMLRQAHQLWKL
jgi:acetoin utilization deacetylase AcuC-like enzyme